MPGYSYNLCLAIHLQLLFHADFWQCAAEICSAVQHKPNLTHPPLPQESAISVNLGSELHFKSIYGRERWKVYTSLRREGCKFTSCDKLSGKPKKRYEYRDEGLGSHTEWERAKSAVAKLLPSDFWGPFLRAKTEITCSSWLACLLIGHNPLQFPLTHSNCCHTSLHCI